MMTALQHADGCQQDDAQVAQETAAACARAPKVLPAGMYFIPWIGRNFKRSPVFDGTRILIVGSSHYEWCARCWKSAASRNDTAHSREADFTCRCVAEVACGKASISHWRRIANCMLGRDANDATVYEFWHSVAYYNFIQEIVGLKEEGQRAPAPTQEMISRGHDLFRPLLDLLQPDLIVVLGRTAYQELPKENEKFPNLRANGKEVWRCGYRLKSGKSATAAAVAHPARGLGAPWHPVMRKVLARI